MTDTSHSIVSVSEVSHLAPTHVHLNLFSWDLLPNICFFRLCVASRYVKEFLEYINVHVEGT